MTRYYSEDFERFAEKIAHTAGKLGLVEKDSDDEYEYSVNTASTGSVYLTLYGLKRTVEIRFSNHAPNRDFRGYWAKGFREAKNYAIENLSA